MRKFLILSIIICLTFSLFACGQNKFNPGEDNSEIDFRGMEFRFLGMSFPEKKKGSGIADAVTDGIFDRVAEINKQYNVELVGETDDVATSVLAASLSGRNGYDVVYSDFTVLYDLYNIGALIPFSESGVNDTESEKWGEEYMNQLSTFNGTRYGFFPNLWNSVPHLFGLPTTCLEYLEELNMQNPIEFLEAGEWTWDVFKEEMRKATYTDENGEHYGFGMDGIATVYAQTGMISNGGGIMKNIDGRVVVTMADENSKKGIEFMKSLFDEGLAVAFGPAAISDFGNYDSVEDAFWGTKKVAYYGGGGGFGSNSEEFSIICVPFPLGPDAKENGYSSIVLEQGLGAVCSLTAYSSEDIGLILEELFEPINKNYPRGWKDYEVEFKMVDERQLKYTMIAISNAVVCNQLACKDTYIDARTTLQNIVHGSLSTSAIDSVADAMQAEINQYYKQ